MRAHLAELLPIARHASFSVELTIHQLWNVPLVSGDFSVRWKFQNANPMRSRIGQGFSKKPNSPSGTNNTNVDTNGSSGKMKGKETPQEFNEPGRRSTNVNTNGHSHTQPQTLDSDVEYDVLMPSGASMLSIPASEGSSSSQAHSYRSYSQQSQKSASMSSYSSPRADSFDLPSGGEDAKSTTRTSFNINPTESHNTSRVSSGNLVNDLSPDVHHPNGSSITNPNDLLSPASPSPQSTEARGRTPYVPLREHNVKWDHNVRIGSVQIGIARDATHMLSPCELKLIVEQRSYNPSPATPQTQTSFRSESSRFGSLTLNLSAYADRGPITRRYLLRESKTNATLQLTLSVVRLPSNKDVLYKVPELQGGEIMVGVSALLEKSARPEFGRMGSSTMSSRGGRSSTRLTRRGSETRLREESGLGGGLTGSSHRARSRPRTPLPELELDFGGKRLGGGGGLKETDNIIEAIFNPVPSSSPVVSPFTFFVPTRPRPERLVMDMPARTNSMGSNTEGEESTGNGSVYSMRSQSILGEGRPPSIAPSARSTGTTGSRSSTGTGDGSPQSQEPGIQRFWRRLITSNNNKNDNLTWSPTISGNDDSQNVPDEVGMLRGPRRVLSANRRAPTPTSTTSSVAPQIVVVGSPTSAIGSRRSTSSSREWGWRRHRRSESVGSVGARSLA